ncbi:MAG: BrnT family toxin [Burkholderiales bacterium]
MGVRVYDAPITTREDDRLDYGEHRINLLGWLDSKVIHMTYTERGDDFHAISLRKATKHEAREYFSQVHHSANQSGDQGRAGAR